MDIIIKKYGFKEGLTTLDGKITNWPYDEPQPSQEELTEWVALDEAKNRKINILKEYLTSTDWYCLRFADRGIEYPDEVKNKREQARNFINDIEALTTKEEVEAYNIDAIL
jgi:hypothetical protein